MEDLIKIGFGVALTAVGVYLLASTFIPRLRTKWQGTDIVAGPLSCLAFALFFAHGAILLVFSGLPIQLFGSKAVFNLVLFVLVWCLILLGYKLDCKNNVTIREKGKET